MTFSEFRENGRLGCPTCYQEFRQELLPLLENIHEDNHHIGKRPARSPGQTPEQSQVIQLRHQQRDAIEHEDYEKAAELRDRIAEIEASLHRIPPPAESSDET
jgi:protein arginine kinase activator